jgi:hypothetical protein
MSEYQYYVFRALDRLLTDRDMRHSGGRRTLILTLMPRSGMLVPILGSMELSARSRRKSLADALFTKT